MAPTPLNINVTMMPYNTSIAYSFSPKFSLFRPQYWSRLTPIIQVICMCIHDKSCFIWILEKIHNWQSYQWKVQSDVKTSSQRLLQNELESLKSKKNILMLLTCNLQARYNLLLLVLICVLHTIPFQPKSELNNTFLEIRKK